MLRINNFPKAILFFLLLAIPTQFGKHFWFPFAYVMGQRVDYLSPTVYASDILIAILVFISLVQILRHCERPRGVRQSLWSMGILLYLSLGIFFSQNPFNGWYVLLKFLEFTFFGWFITKEKNISPLLFWTFLIDIVIEGALGVGQFFHQGSLGGIWYSLGERSFTASTPGIANASIRGQLVLRPYATFSHPNVFAGYLVIALLFFLTFVFSTRDLLRKILATIILILGFCVLLLTLSRAAIVVFILLSLLFFILKFSKWRMWILLGACVLGFGILLNPLVGGRFADMQGYAESLTLRDILVQSSWWMFVSHPLVGVGLGNFLPSLPRYLPERILFGFLQPVHNIFLLVLAETGILGLGIFLWVLWRALQRAWRSKQHPLSQFALLSLLAICLIGMTDHYFLTLQQGQLLFALILGIAFSRLKVK